MTLLLSAAMLLPILMSGWACLRRRPGRVVRRMGVAVCVLLVVYAAWHMDWSEIMARGKGSKRGAVAEAAPTTDALAEAIKLMEARDWNKAKAKYLEAADAARYNPTKVMALGFAAECSFYQGPDQDKETRALIRALMADPAGAGKGYRIRGWIAERNGDKDAAAQEYASGVQVRDPQCPLLLATLGK